MIIPPHQDVAEHFEMDETERAIVTAYIQQDGWKLIKKLIEQEIRLLNVHLLNTPEEQTEAVLSRFKVAKAAAMVYAGVIKRLEEARAIQEAKSLGIGTMANPESIPLMPEFE
jgi:hypothetical protein